MTEPIASYRDREEWLRERKSGIGGSDAAKVLGVSPYGTPLDVWREKTSEAIPPELTGIRPKMGRLLEPVAAELYVEETGRQVRRQPLRRHPELPFMLGNVDRQILAVGEVVSTGVLEIKCPGIRVFATVKARGLTDDMTVQLMHYLAVLGYDWGSFALFTSEGGLIHFDLEADRQLIDQLTEREHEFWTKYVEPRVPPPVEDLPALDIPQVEGELTVVSGERWREAAVQLQEAKALSDAAGELEAAAKAQLQELMDGQGLSTVEIDGLARLYWRQAAGGTSWKQTAEHLAEAAKLPLDDFVVKGKGIRPFKAYFLRPEVE